jgi:RNA polymerase sigma-70 factor (ECF subfamily)
MTPVRLSHPSFTAPIRVADMSDAGLSELDRAAHHRGAELPCDPVAAGGADSCDLAARNEQLRVTLRSIAALPPRQRDALALRALDGRGYDELAVHFTLTENAAVQLVHRARRNLLALVA